MPRSPTTDAPSEEKSFWKGLARDLLVAAAIIAIVLISIYVYAGVWPPLVVVESSSMQHGYRESFIGVIDTGDMVFQQAAPNRAAVVTYLEGRSSGYQTYGDYGDVIIFRRPSNPTPVIHRAIMFVVLHEDGTVDVPALANLPDAEWEGWNETGERLYSAYNLTSVTIHRMGFGHDLGIRFDLTAFVLPGRTEGYVTMGDNNAYLYCSQSRDPCAPSVPYDRGWLVEQGDIIGRARGEIPWFGLIKLLVSPTDACCPNWGHDEAPKNSWDSLLISLLVLIALPFLIELAGRGWTKYVSPRFPKIRWPWQRKRRETETPDGEAFTEPPPVTLEEPPREGSSGP